MKAILIILIGFAATLVNAQQFSEKINREFTFEKKSPDNAIMIANINGHVKVTGYDGDKIILEVTRSVFGKTDSRLERGKEEVQLGVMDRADTIILYVKDGCSIFGQRIKGRKNNGSWMKNGWGYNWNQRNNDCDMPYEYKMDFTLKVPTSVHVIASTINEGDITIENVKGMVDANNINGSIRLTNLIREADASTINGDVDIEYSVNPPKDCRFYTLNGDINALFQKGLAASLSFESFNGSFYTNINDLKPLPVKVEKSAKGEGIKYKVNGNRYQVGTGGAYLDFETFNGNVYLKEKTN
jgi:hypothetical protein